MSDTLFRNLITTAVAYAKHGTLAAEQSGGDFNQARELIKRGEVRIELRICFDPTPSATVELIRDEDGELVGQLFQETARPLPAAN